MKNNPKVYILVLQYNHSEETIKCLESLRVITYENVSFVVIDNASTDHHTNATRLYLENTFKHDQNYKFISNKDNLGYTGGNNAGIDYAMENDADYILIMNNDVEVALNFLEPLIETSESDKMIGITQAVVSEEDKDSFGGGPIKWLSNTQLQITTKPESKILPNNSYVMGSVMLIKRSVIEQVGKFDDRYFLYFEDVDLSVRAKQNGYKLAYAADSHVIHSTATSASELGASILHRYHYRNALLFNSKHGKGFVKHMLPFWAMWVFAKQSIKLILGKRPEVSAAIMSGITDYKEKKFGKI